MTMNLLFGCLYFAVSLYFALFEGVGTCFALCYLPALLFFRPLPGYIVNAGIPDLTAANTAAMAMLIGILIRAGKKFPFRWTLVDTLVAIAPVLTVISTMLTENVNNTYENFHIGYNDFVKQLFGWLIPYFVARASFHSEKFRVRFLWVLLIGIFILTPFAVIEMRFWPQYYVQCLQKFGFQVANDPLVMTRLGLYRTQVSFTHPIFFGDACLSMVVLLPLLAHTTHVGTRNWVVRLGWGCAAIELVASLSFGPFTGLFLAVLVFLFLWYFRSVRWLLPSLAVLVVAGFFVFTKTLADLPLPPRPGGNFANDSFWIRRMIVKLCWPFVSTAGWFGWGRIISPKALPLESVDNAYILFAMCRGWLYCAIWVSMPILVGQRVVKAMRAFKASQVHIFPLAIGAAGVMGISAAFYGVWAGWAGEPYTMLWLTLVAFVMSLSEMCIEAGKAPLPVMRHANEVLQPPEAVPVPA